MDRYGNELDSVTYTTAAMYVNSVLYLWLETDCVVEFYCSP